MANTEQQWPADNSTLSKLIRGKEWQNTPLSSVKDWPQSLKNAVDLALGCDFPMVVLWGDELVQIYNDGYSLLMADKHPEGLGLPTRECWPEVWEFNKPIYERVFKGETITHKDQLFRIIRHGKPEDAWFTLCYSPLKSDNGEIAGVLVTVYETTTRVQAEIAHTRRDQLQEEQARLLELIASGASVDKCLSSLCSIIPRLNEGTRASIMLINEEGNRLTRPVSPDFPTSWCDGQEGTPISDLYLGTCSEAIFHRKPVTCENIKKDDRWSKMWRELCLTNGVKAGHSEPIFDKEGKPAGSFMLCFDKPGMPGKWEKKLADYGSFISSILLEREKSDKSLRESEERYRTLFDSMDEGYCIIEMIFDEEDNPVDYRFIEVNPAFTEQTGLENAVGRRILELNPKHESYWLKKYGRIAVTGKPERFINEAKGLNRWYDVYAFRVGEPEERKVAILFNDITARKQQEDRDKFLIEFNDAIRFLTNPDEIQLKAARVLGEYLSVSRVSYFFVSDTKYVIEEDYADNVPSLTGGYSIQSFGPYLYESYRAGQVAISTDVENNPNFSKTEREAFAAIQVRAFIGIPLIKSGKFVAGLAVHMNESREWTETEITLVEEVAERTWAAVERARAEKALRESKEELQEDLKRFTLLQEISTELIKEDDVQSLYEKIVDSALSLMHSEFASLQILHNGRDGQGELELLAYRGFSEKAAQYWKWVTLDDGTSCAKTMRTGKRVIVPDVLNCTFMEISDDLKIYLKEGIRAVQTTPLYSRSGKLQGTISTHWNRPHEPSELDLRLMDILARLAADLIERAQVMNDLQNLNEALEVRVEKRTAALLSYQNQLRSLASELNKAEERERQRLAAVLHDNLGQMLAIGKLKLDLLHQQKNQIPEQIQSEINEIAVLVEDALSYTRELMSDLKPPPSLDKQNLVASIRWVVDKMKKHGLKSTLVDDGNPKPLDDEIRNTLRQCTRELLFNVVKHAGVDEARIELSRRNNQVEIIVEDKGRGFNSEEEKKPGPDRNGGFGLFNVYERMDLLGGSFEIKSNPGIGTRAILRAPVKDGSKSLSKIPKSANHQKKNKIFKSSKSPIRVLLADDHQMMRVGLLKIIEEQQDLAVIAEASDGKEAVRLAKETSPDVIVMDVNMPGMNGIEATRKIITDAPHIRIIGLSLHNKENVVQAMRDAGATAYLTKSDVIETLCATIRSEANSADELVK